MHHNQEYIGVDYGSARVGLARGSSLARLAEPLKTVSTSRALTEITELIKANQAAGVVVGLPRNLEGIATDQTRSVKNWVEELKDEVKLPIYWQDEALTSVAAAANKAADIDAVAAAAILQDFLDSPETDRVEA